MYFLLFDPIFWINRTLATFDRMVVKLQKHIAKCNTEMEANKETALVIDAQTKVEVQKKKDEQEVKVAKIREKSEQQISKITNRNATAVVNLTLRNEALALAKKRAETTVNNIKKITGGE